MEEFEHLSLSRTSSIEQSYGFQLVDGVPLTPPLVPTPGPTSPPPVPLPSPSPVLPSSPPPARIAQNWSTDEVERVVGLFYHMGPKYRAIARHVVGRSEDAVRQLLKRRGLLAPRSSPVRRRPSKAPRWSKSEDRRLLEAFEAVPRRQSGSVPWSKVKAAAGLDRLPHSLRNRLARLSER